MFVGLGEHANEAYHHCSVRGSISLSLSLRLLGDAATVVLDMCIIHCAYIYIYMEKQIDR